MGKFIKPKNTSKKSKNTEIDWLPQPGEKPLSRITRIMAMNDTRQINKFSELDIPEELPTGRYSIIYGMKPHGWELIGYKCLECGKAVSKLDIIQKHPLACKKELLINKDKGEQDMPIRRTEKGYYWGSKGPFPTKEKAEEVAKAAYSSGYKEPKKEDKK